MSTPEGLPSEQCAHARELEGLRARVDAVRSALRAAAQDDPALAAGLPQDVWRFVAGD